jgi:putative membrane protein insertion efficiency factor
LAQEKAKKPPTFSSPALIPVKFYQKFLSGVDGNRCPMYPTCSRFCIEAVQKHGLFKGWIMTCDRLIRCGRDEIQVSQKIWLNGKAHCYDPVDANDFWWKNNTSGK